ncbi:hypothetical protein Calab_1442 [Caldithrix abyssi DSM 13497]|uniref:Uncharacterized protein n=1 Tax=Caldithrix abyssi DSM 13497 TaxID=880073 RepID=H1XPT7_CALAY|nr:hypothetical protein [Caldithrix abyssi]APF20410.1 hypothetical protein Cabys_3664 [Caldithrix abyssi DSM 13497]EHO41063.1 hypothetical protein Calab_1442 [Caldithrix abyssi DSM 13497]
MQDKIQSAIQKLEKFISEVGLIKERRLQLQEIVSDLKKVKKQLGKASKSIK